MNLDLTIDILDIVQLIGVILDNLLFNYEVLPHFKLAGTATSSLLG